MFSPEVEAEITDYAARDVSASVIRKQLEQKYPASEIPSERAIDDRLRKLRPVDPSEPWTLSDATGDDAALVLPVLHELIQRTEGRVMRLTRVEAEWIIRIRKALPRRPAWYAFVTARTYMAATAGAGENTIEEIDAALAFAAWWDGATDDERDDHLARYNVNVVGPPFPPVLDLRGPRDSSGRGRTTK